MTRRGYLLFVLGFFSILSFFLFSCFQGGGSGVETTNGISGSFREDSGPAKGILVTLYDADFDPHQGIPPNIPQDTTDQNGNYIFQNVRAGTYSIIAQNIDNGKMAIHLDVTKKPNESKVLASKRLTASGILRIPTFGLSSRSADYLYIPGTHLFINLPVQDSTVDCLVLNKVPEANYTRIRYHIDNGSIDRNILTDTLRVKSGDTTTISPFFQWKFSDTLFLNTMVSGANVLENVTDFPLRVRLEKTRFNFTQADSAGRDIRFAKSDGTPLSFEIETWNKDSGWAEIWVLMDTVLANSKSQFLTLHWGIIGASNYSGKTRVFDSSLGFAGVWHLKEEVADTGSKKIYKNSVRDSDHGDDYLHSTDRAGVIGYGHGFDGSEFIRVTAPGNGLKPARYITASGWYRATVSDSGGAMLATMGDSYGLKMDETGKTRLFVYVGQVHSSPLTDINVKDGKWHYLVGTFNGTRIDSYVDGAFLKSFDKMGVITYDLGSDFFIGTHGNGLTDVDAMGSIDEIQISTVTRTAAWIKLSFMNQKENQLLVEFRQ